MIKRDLRQWLSYLEQLHPTAIDMGLERCREVLQRLGMKRPAPRVVTVTGTNGKGSTCAFLASLLKAQGLKVGVYSSPHLLRYNERVRIDGVEATDAALCDAFEAVEAARGQTSLTYFEMGTLAAFWLFERSALDAVVLEVGLGGRLDAVNLIDADIAIVTNIGIDHSDWLGDTRDSIGFEKAGIFRAGKPALCGDEQPPQTLIEQAETLGAPLWLRNRDFGQHMAVDHWNWFGRDRQGQALQLSDLPPLDLPVENAALALQAFALLELPWQPQALVAGLKAARMTGRLDRRELMWKGKPLSLLLDVAHNPHAADYLARRLSTSGPVRHAVFGLLQDKDLPGVIEPVLSLISDWAVADLDTPRSQSAALIGDYLREKGADVSILPTLQEALTLQCDKASAGDEILVFGSFFCVAEALAWLGHDS